MKRSIFLIAILSFLMINTSIPAASNDLLKNAAIISTGAILAGMGCSNLSGLDSTSTILTVIAGSGLAGHYFPKLMANIAALPIPNNSNAAKQLDDSTKKLISISTILSGTGIYLKYLMPLISAPEIKVAGIAGSVLASICAGEAISSAIEQSNSITNSLRQNIQTYAKNFSNQYSIDNGFYFGTAAGTAMTCCALWNKLANITAS